MIASSDFSSGHRMRHGCIGIRGFRCLSVGGKCRRQSFVRQSQTGPAIPVDLLSCSSLAGGRWTRTNTRSWSTGITETSGGYCGRHHRTGCVSRSLFMAALLAGKSLLVQDCQSESTSKGQSRIFWNWTGTAKCQSFQSYRDSRLTSITSASKCTQPTGLILRNTQRLGLAQSVGGRLRKRLATYCDRFASGELTFTGLGSSVRRCETSCAAWPVLTRWRGHLTPGTQERRAARSMSGLANLSRTVRTVTTQLLSGTKKQCL
jgi:hypothetical protein